MGRFFSHLIRFVLQQTLTQGRTFVHVSIALSSYNIILNKKLADNLPSTTQQLPIHSGPDVDFVFNTPGVESKDSG